MILRGTREHTLRYRRRFNGIWSNPRQQHRRLTNRGVRRQIRAALRDGDYEVLAHVRDFDCPFLYRWL